MEIKCRSFSCHAESHGHGVTQTILANEVNHDLLLEEITHEKGISFVLDSFGKQALAEYMRQQGFHVTEQAEAA